jgi:hypothetical protein
MSPDAHQPHSKADSKLLSEYRLKACWRLFTLSNRACQQEICSSVGEFCGHFSHSVASSAFVYRRLPASDAPV